MYEYIQGVLAELTATTAVVETGGIGYLLQISMQTYEALAGRSEVRLYVHQHLREDAVELYGFSAKAEREVFRLLTSVAGVGPSTARMVLSTYGVEELTRAIGAGDVDALKRVKGIGLKTAQRIVVDLSEKVGGVQADAGGIAQGRGSSARQEALSALMTLGFAKGPTEKVLDDLLRADATMGVEALVKQALKRM